MSPANRTHPLAPHRRALGEIIDQRQLPHRFAMLRLAHADAVATAIATWRCDAPFVGAAGAYGLALALQADAGDTALPGKGAGDAAGHPADRSQSALGATTDCRSCRAATAATARRRRVAGRKQSRQ